MIFASVLASAAVGGVLHVALSPNAAHADTIQPSDIGTLKTQVDDLRKEVVQLRGRFDSAQSAAASLADSPARKAVEAPSSSPANDAMAHATPVDRDTILAVLDQREKDKDKERKEKQQKQLVDGMESRVKQSAERLGLDANTTQSILKLYMDNLAREADIHRAYPYTDRNDPNAEKARLEIDAARKSLDTTLQGIIPADKWNDWNNQTRFLRRAGDMAYAIDQPQNANGGMFGGFGGGRGGNNTGGRGNGGNNNGGGANNTAGGNNGGNRGNRGNRQNQQSTGAAPAPQTNTNGGKQP